MIKCVCLTHAPYVGTTMSAFIWSRYNPADPLVLMASEPHATAVSTAAEPHPQILRREQA